MCPEGRRQELNAAGCEKVFTEQVSSAAQRPKLRATAAPAARLVLTILAGVATWERELMLERQCEGIAEAKAATKVGRRAFARSRALLELDEDCRASPSA